MSDNVTGDHLLDHGQGISVIHFIVELTPRNKFSGSKVILKDRGKSVKNQLCLIDGNNTGHWLKSPL
jgi:hypothetical protein